MNDVTVIILLREALMITLLVSSPVLVSGMVVGLIVSVFQTTTSIQEQTLTFVPKMIAIFLAIVLSAAWMIHMLVNYTQQLLMQISETGAI
ncbi:MAG: flagellar biosynthesis protein FliQ [Spirochaetes bacterium]|nr:flagellar biosynthesis protein FliQ [Spirochaetota bacterium]MBN2770894.1 flagellar biosynthesis protein FliQ [Spirochaetota bacterium]